MYTLIEMAKEVEIEETLLPNGAIRFLAINNKGEIVGSAFVGKEYPRFIMQVNPHYQDKGIGRRLLAGANNYLPYGVVGEFNPEPGKGYKLQKFYERMGFKIIEGQVVK